MHELAYRDKARNAGVVIAALRTQMAAVARAQTLSIAVRVLVLIGAIVGGALIAVQVAFFGGAVALLILILGIANGRPRRLLDKLEFAVDTLELLAPELHPNARLRLRLDLRAYDDTAFTTRTWRSAAGREKKKYRSRWFTLQTTLADGTQVTIQRTVGIKVKRGAIAAERRKLIIAVVPHRARYRPIEDKDGKPLQREITGIVREFHNRPEDLGCKRITAGADRGFAVRVIQDDAPILPREVVAVLGAIVRFLDQRRLRKRAAA